MNTSTIYAAAGDVYVLFCHFPYIDGVQKLSNEGIWTPPCENAFDKWYSCKSTIGNHATL